MLIDLQYSKQTASKDKYIFIYTGLAIRIIANLLLIELIIGLLIVPIIIIYAVRVTLLKILDILAASGLFIIVLLSIIYIKAIEVYIREVK